MKRAEKAESGLADEGDCFCDDEDDEGGKW